MWAVAVVVAPEGCRLPGGNRYRIEQRPVKQLVAEAAVAALDRRVVGRRPSPVAHGNPTQQAHLHAPSSRWDRRTAASDVITQLATQYVARNVRVFGSVAPKAAPPTSMPTRMLRIPIRSVFRVSRTILPRASDRALMSQKARSYKAPRPIRAALALATRLPDDFLELGGQIRQDFVGVRVRALHVVGLKQLPRLFVIGNV